MQSKLNNLLVFLVFLLLMSGCAVTNKYGPYMGKVVDKETLEPLKGAVVFMRFYTVKATVAGGVTRFCDAAEVLTDNQGEFYMSPPRIWRKSEFWEGWEKGHVIIFKPGYGAYPGHGGSGPQFMPNGTLPEDEYVTIRLPKLITIKERARNVRSVTFTAKIPLEKWKHLFDARNMECKQIGLETWPKPE